MVSGKQGETNLKGSLILTNTQILFGAVIFNWFLGVVTVRNYLDRKSHARFCDDLWVAGFGFWSFPRFGVRGSTCFPLEAVGSIGPDGPMNMGPDVP